MAFVFAFYCGCVSAARSAQNNIYGKVLIKAIKTIKELKLKRSNKTICCGILLSTKQAIWFAAHFSSSVYKLIDEHWN